MQTPWAWASQNSEIFTTLLRSDAHALFNPKMMIPLSPAVTQLLDDDKVARDRGGKKPKNGHSKKQKQGIAQTVANFGKAWTARTPARCECKVRRLPPSPSAPARATAAGPTNIRPRANPPVPPALPLTLCHRLAPWHLGQPHTQSAATPTCSRRWHAGRIVRTGRRW